MTDVWIVIPNWDRFQHYRDRNPTWIKNYPELLSDDAYTGLSFHARGVLHGIWMEYARASRQFPGSTLTVTRRLGGKVTTKTLESLRDAGFIQFSASKPLAPRYPPAIPEGERDKNPPYPPHAALAGDGGSDEENQAVDNGRVPTMSERLGLTERAPMPDETRALMKRLGTSTRDDDDLDKWDF